MKVSLMLDNTVFTLAKTRLMLDTTASINIFYLYCRGENGYECGVVVIMYISSMLRHTKIMLGYE
jgi:hypothetical protein